MFIRKAITIDKEENSNAKQYIDMDPSVNSISNQVFVRHGLPGSSTLCNISTPVSSTICNISTLVEGPIGSIPQLCNMYEAY